MYISAQLYKVAQFDPQILSKENYSYFCLGYYDYLVFKERNSLSELYKSSGEDTLAEKKQADQIQEAPVLQTQVLLFYTDDEKDDVSKDLNDKPKLFLREFNDRKYYYLLTELKLVEQKITLKNTIENCKEEIEKLLNDERNKSEGFDYGLFFSLGYSDFVLCLEAQSINKLYAVISAIRKNEKGLIKSSFSTLISPISDITDIVSSNSQQTDPFDVLVQIRNSSFEHDDETFESLSELVKRLNIDPQDMEVYWPFGDSDFDIFFHNIDDENLKKLRSEFDSFSRNKPCSVNYRILFKQPLFEEVKTDKYDDHLNISKDDNDSING